ncbi:MAG: nitroreductase family protein [Planctomycetes bacterium]|mgnify:CR=1 FL=1|jgi:nitroreductase|nr:nitroreductase family protein [Planctomycetota bacterium]HON45624.1 nitroreductase family protein [Planctomycetota bacterium]HPY74315.1 nitroreductase family protein [Planctomycetota bacterium]HQA99867.1 nitroreductase family protein [Planctomycetota bacterium]HRU50804.1 nitroreductase family protein [Planctomycetota bacterium]
MNEIFTRKSVRAYTDQPIEKEILVQLLKAGMAAPTACNSQPWSFVVITEKETLTAISQGMQYWQMLPTAAASIIVCGVPSKSMALPGVGREYWIQDCSAALQNIMLEAESHKIGSVWLGCYPNQERVDHIRKVLDIPKDIIPFGVISLGYPLKEEKAKDKFKEENIHWEKW